MFGGRMRKVGPTPAGFFWLVLCLCALLTRPASAAALPGAELTLSRSAAAASCPSEDVIAKELARRLAPRAQARQPLLLHVDLDVQGTAFTAKILVLGRRQGERNLSAEGPGCEPLRDVLVVSLLLLLDDDAESDAPEDMPLAPIRAPVPTVWLTAGGAATHGLPRDWSSAWYVELALRLPSWDFALGGFWAPDRRVDFAPGSVTLQTLAARAHSCYVIGLQELRLGGCVFGALATLRGRAQEFSSNSSARRSWLLFGAGPELRWAVLSRLSLGLSGQVLAAPFQESFSIQNLPGSAYRSDRWLGWLGADLSVQIW
ncbi:MAG TPA: hypothetical protein VGF76_09655 [Polyangiaceae bacterium]|jgi:hypothetical protein